ncbi:endonuclease/exonuclease/phosphatase family protein [Curvivirga aplysinae]|uniref:endonuclease/exonuclease/phosphatase family protein n=1 Tax=Curvivirga aplysinae TaxID=2529852 RepID=UPI0012BCD0B1|nr:endonuclease/exonuclease/phosphatase family protein [Curvivirga aplysinae]MTI10099.1 hypothetical protein [Curvivirga aplysinae]
MHILSWNIQAGLGCDGEFNLKRISDVICKKGEPDVICLQEVSRNFPEYGNDDQLSYFTKVFPNHDVVWGAAVSGRGDTDSRLEFGNLSLIRSPYLLDSRLHRLPYPVLEDTPQMPRVLIEVAVKYQDSSISILNTHLAFHSQYERYAQANYISKLVKEINIRKKNIVPVELAGAYTPFAKPQFTLLCGDLNLEMMSDEYELLTDDKCLKDCWTYLYEDHMHAPTCGVFDQKQWPHGPHCRDYFMICDDLSDHVENMSVDIETDASDHQPISIFLKD